MNSPLTKAEQLRNEVLMARAAKLLARRTRGEQEDAIVPATRDAALPLSWAQQRLWLLGKMDAAAGVAYHVPFAMRLRGQLNRDVLRAALDGLVARHEILRTRFVAAEAGPVQEIAAPDCGFDLRMRDVSTLADAERQAAAQELMAATAREPFALATGPLARGLLLRIGSGEHWLVLTQHHIITDEWSTGILTRELGVLYAAASTGTPHGLPPQRLQYADFATWQRMQISADTLQRQRDYWLSQLRGAPAVLDLSLDRPRGLSRNWAGRRHSIAIPAALCAEIQQLNRQFGTTTFMTALTAFAVLLSRWSGAEDVVVGTPVANRSRPEVESMLGLFVNSLALRVQFEGDPTVEALLHQVRDTVLGGHKHQDIPFEQVVEALNPQRSASHSPIFQVMLTMNNISQRAALDLPGLTIEGLDLGTETTHFDLQMYVSEMNGALSISLLYASALFEAGTITRLGQQFEQILRSMVADPAQPVSRLNLLREGERALVLERFNASAVPFAPGRTIHGAFEAQAARTPHAPALAWQGRVWSYDELNRQANRVAHALLAHGVKPDQFVGLCTPRGADMIVGLLGILKAGAAYVPLDPAYPSERLDYIVQDCAPAVVLAPVDWPQAARWQSAQRPVLCLDMEGEALRGQPEHDPDAQALGLHDEHLAYVIYTSGSTGTAKGVMVQHRSAVNFWEELGRSTHRQCPAGAQVALNASFAFDMSLKGILQLLSGHCLHIVPQEIRADGAAMLRFLAEHRVDAFDCTPSQLEVLLAAGLLTQGDYRPTSVLIGGEALSEATWEILRASPITQFYNMYGPTECTVDVTLGLINGADAKPHIGKPLGNARVYILDPHRQPVPVGMAGELYLGGMGVARGYLNRPELNAERFLPDPFAGQPGARMYKSGDLGSWREDGAITYLGRNDFQVKLRGFRIELGEIEAALRACEEVKDGVVLVREDSPGDRRLVAYVTARAGQTPTARALRDTLARHLTEYMLPSAFVVLDAFPLTPNGKLDRRALPVPDEDASARSDYAAPEGEMERAIAAIWQELLGVSHIGRNDNFFELGGHSMLIFALVERMRTAGVEVAMGAVFGTPTVRGLATLAAAPSQDNAPAFTNGIPVGTVDIAPALLPLVKLSQAQIDALVSAVPGGAANVEDIYPLAPLQEGMLFHHLLDKHNDPFLIRTVLQIDSRSHVEALLDALQRTIARHDILRTSIHWEGMPRPLQLVRRRVSLQVETLELELHADPLSSLTARTTGGKGALDLAQAPLMRLHLAPHEDGKQWYACLVHHHIVADHIAMAQILREVSAHMAGRSDTLPDVHRFSDFITTLEQQQANASLDYFQELLKDLDVSSDLFSTDGSAPSSELKCVHDLAPELSVDIRAASRRAGVSIAAVFHAAWALVLAKCSDGYDVVFGSVLAGRSRAGEGADRKIGMFLNTLPLRLDLEGMMPGQLLDVTQAQLAALLLHEQTSLSAVTACASLPAGRNLFSTLLNMRHREEAAAEQRAEQAEGFSGIRTLQIDQTSVYGLEVSVDDLGSQFSFVVQSRSFDAERVATFFETALHSLVAALGVSEGAQPALALNILPQEELAHIQAEFNATACNTRDACMVNMPFEEQSARNPAATALVFEGQRMSYGELNRRANQLAHRLHRLGIGAGSRVAICSGRNIERVVALLGVLKSGAAYVPVDPASPDERIAYMLADCTPAFIVTEAGRRAACAAAGVPVLTLETMAEELAGEAGHNLALAPEDAGKLPAYVMYTSGSTGQPKGAVVEHGNVLNLLADNAWCTIEEQDCVAQVANPAFDTCIWEIFGALLRGARVLVLPPSVVLDPAALQAALLAENVSHLALPTGLFAEYAEVLRPAFARMRYVLVGGDKLDPNVAARLLASDQRPQHLLNVYGPTEAAFVVLTHEVKAGAQAGRSIPIGKPIANTQIHILDRFGNTVPIGVRGEIHIGGKSVGSGYWNRPALTAERYLPDPFNDTPGARLYRTGDLGRWLPDGTVEFLGRNDFQVKLRGFRIELGEIEACLSACPGVRDAVVMVREETGAKRLVAYLLVEPGAHPAPDALRTALARQLAEYMLPSAFVALETFPLTPNGKVDRKALPAPERASMVARSYAAPQGPVEEAIAALWRQLLAVELVGRDDNFFELGGHSLLAVQFVTRMHADLHAQLSLSDVIAAPTLAGIAALLQPGRADATPNLERMRDGGEQPPLFFVHDGTGELSYARRLLSWIPEAVPVYGFSAGVTRGDAEAVDGIPEMAARYLRQMRSVQAQGPYRLAGYSAGGAIAYEMAQQLLGTDDSVGLLLVLDSLPDYRGVSSFTAPAAPGEQELATLDLIDIVAGLADLPSAVLAQLRGMADTGTLDEVLACCKAHGLLPAFLDKTFVRNHLAFSRRLVQALRSYAHPASQSLPLHLIVARDDREHDITPGWQAIAGGRLQVWPVGGDHLSMMASPNVEQVGLILARLLSEAGEHSVAHPELTYAPCITIQAGRGGHKPLFCVPGAGAAVTAFAPMAPVLRDTPIYGFQPRGYCGTMAPHADVPSAARAYIAAMRKVDPDGPYRLAGHSFGGWVAFDMASQLHAMGAEVELLLLLDSEAPHTAERPPKPCSRIEILMKLVSLFELTLPHGSLGIEPADFEARDAQAQVALLLERLVAHRLMPARTSSSMLGALLRVFSANLNSGYQPAVPYPGTVHLASVRDQGDPASIADDAAAIEGWRTQVGTLLHFAGGGNHNTLLTSPHIDAVLGWVKPLL